MPQAKEVTIDEIRALMRKTADDAVQSALGSEAIAKTIKSTVAEAVAGLQTSISELAKGLASAAPGTPEGQMKQHLDERREKARLTVADTYEVSERKAEEIADDIEKADLELMIWGSLRKWDAFAQRQAGREYRLMVEAHNKAQTAGQDTQGGYLVPPMVLLERIIPGLEAQVVAARLGAQFETGFDGQPVTLPRIEGLPDAAFVGEIEEETDDTTMTFGKVELTPRGLVSLMPVSDRLLRMVPTARSIFTSHMSRALARRIDRAVLKGSGINGTPVGILNTAGIGTASWSSLAGGATQTVTSLLENAMGALEDADVQGVRYGWALSPQGRRKLKSFLDSQGRPIFFETHFTSGGNEQAKVGPGGGLFYGFPYATTTQLLGGATAEAIFGAWDQVMVALFSTLLIDSSNAVGKAFRTRQTMLRAYMEMDVGVQQPKAFFSPTAFNAT